MQFNLACCNYTRDDGANAKYAYERKIGVQIGKGRPLPNGMPPNFAISSRKSTGRCVGSKSMCVRSASVQNSYRFADVFPLPSRFCLLTRRFSTFLPQLYIQQHTYISRFPCHIACTFTLYCLLSWGRVK